MKVIRKGFRILRGFLDFSSALDIWSGFWEEDDFFE
jgi:hypothetical protein